MDSEPEKKKCEKSNSTESLEKHSDHKENFTTGSGVKINRFYSPESSGGFSYNKKLGFPGQFPFTRGVYPTMYRGRLWTMRQYAGLGSAEETNRRFHYLVDQGQTGLSVAFDLPTQMGYDSDHPLAEGEVGRTGVAVDTLKDMEMVFAGLPLDRISTSMTINAPACILLAMYVILGKKHEIQRDRLRGTIQNDILKEYIARGTYIYPPQSSLRLTVDAISYCAKELPHWNPISISGYHIREAGATVMQELAFTLASAVTYLEAILKRELFIDDIAPRISFFFGCGANFFEEIAKFRAGRRLWAQIIKKRFRAKNSSSMALRFHTQTCGSSLTAQQPKNNIARVTLQALAAVLGGTQSLHTNSFDEALALPTEQSVRVALRTQQIIAHETGADQTIDPLGGSYYLENLTDQIEKRVQEYIERIDQMGGMLEAIEQGYIQNRISESAHAKQKDIENRKRVIVGVNKFTGEEEVSQIEITKVDPKTRDRQLKRIKFIKKSRDSEKVKRTLDKIRNRARGDENLMPYILDAVSSYATVGEISDCLREEFGQYEPDL